MKKFELAGDNNNESIVEKFLKLNLKYKDKKVVVVGDYFLDRFIYFNDADTKVSVYNNGPAYSINKVVLSPGAAGTVAKNLSLLGIQVFAVGFCGKDGDGFELKNKLKGLNINCENIIECETKKTPSYTMIMKNNDVGYYESGEASIQNFTKTEHELEEKIIDSIENLIQNEKPDAIIFLDQLDYENYGVITKNIRNYIKEVSKKDIITYFDSRNFLMDSVNSSIIKCNNLEFSKMFLKNDDTIIDCCNKISRNSDNPIIVTKGEEGTLISYKGKTELIPGYKVNGEIDTRGAGDAFTAGFIASLCSEASLKDSTIIGNALAAVCVSQIATTGYFNINDILVLLESEYFNYNGKIEIYIGDIISTLNNKYKILNYLNEGKNGVVYLVECIEGKNKGIKSALKIQYNLETKRLARFYLEIEFLKKQNHEYLLKYYDSGELYYQNNKFPFVVINYVQYTLSNYVILKEVSFKTKLKFSIQLLKVLRELKRQNVLHRDIKPQNILTDGEKIILGDYGLVKPVISDDVNFDIDDFWNSSNTMPRRYRTPELVLHAIGKMKVVPLESDLFQAGLVICWLLTGENPLQITDDKLSPMIFNEIPLIKNEYGEEIRGLIKSMIEYDYKKRCDIDYLLNEFLRIYNMI